MSLKTSWARGFVMVLAFAAQAYATDKTPAATTPPAPLTIDEAGVTIRVDGHLGDWPSARMILLDKASQATLGKTYWKGADDFNGRVFITYDQLYLYVSVIVQKNGEVSSGGDKRSIWNGDCLELFLSTDPDFKKRNRLANGDYHIGLSPGTKCRNPQVYCFNKNKEILGARLIARTVQKGYLMEACIPLSFLDGLDIGPGKITGFNVALDEGGPVSGNRIVQLDYSGDPYSKDKPSSWSTLEWIGKPVVSFPLAHEENIYSYLVQDGTQGTNFLGLKNVAGRVLDSKGKPLAGAEVTTWPKSGTATTDSEGRFELKRIKVYNKTVFYAGMDGFASSLAPLASLGAPVTIQLQGLPPGLDLGANQISPSFFGATLPLPAQGGLDAAVSGTADFVKPLQLKILRLTGMEMAGPPEASRPILDRFIAYAREIGADPMIEVPILRENPEKVEEWVRYCNGVKGYKVKFWTIGDEPDLYDRKGGDPGFKDYNVYNYINDFRVIYNALKTADPAIFVLGPELAWKYAEGEDDWLTPFIQYNGDIVNMASVHHYAAMTADQCTLKNVQKDLGQDRGLIQDLRSRVAENSDHLIPLVITGGSVCPEAVTAKTAKGTGPDSFWSVLWGAEESGLALQENLGMNLAAFLKGGGGTSLVTETGPQPAYWASKLLSSILRGKIIPARMDRSGVSVWAVQDPQTKDVSLLVVNEGDNYFQTKISFNGKGEGLIVDAGLNQEMGYEIPSFAIVRLKMKSDRSGGEAVLYTRKMALAGKGPETSTIKPW